MKKILLADDEELELLYLSSIFEKHGDKYLIVGQARNGLQAMDLANSLRPDIILMDIKMPGLDGLEAAKRIKERHPACTIVIISAYDDFSYARKALQFKVYDYLLKPVSPDEVLSLLNSMTIGSTVSIPVHYSSDQAVFAESDYVRGQCFFETEKSIINSIQTNDLKLFNNMYSVFAEQLKGTAISLEVIRARLMEFNALVCRALICSGQRSQDVSKFSLTNQVSIREISNKYELQRYLGFLQEQIGTFLTSNPDAKDLCKKVISFLGANYASDLSLKEVAKRFYFSPSYLSKMLKKETGLTYTEYLNHLRITQARMLLKNSDLIISKIAVMVGYNDVCHFNRTFKKMMGVNPSQYRRLALEEEKQKSQS
ncbi:MAG TPA: response regulator [Clostridia bacterium]|nr:response regulator [Clostridia bacterium]